MMVAGKEAGSQMVAVNGSFCKFYKFTDCKTLVLFKTIDRQLSISELLYNNV